MYHYDSCHVQGKPYFFSKLHAQVDFWQGSLQLSMMVMTINGSGEYLFFLDLRLCVIICCENPLDQCFCHLLFFHVANRPLSLIKVENMALLCNFDHNFAICSYTT